MISESFGLALAGGSLIGLAAGGLLAFTGKIAGVSGIVDGVTRGERGQFSWKLVFLVGLVSGGAILAWWRPEKLPSDYDASLPLLAIAGVLVGVGTRLGGGCTSGHGVCGMGRLNRRSMLGVVIFMFVAVVTVFVTRNMIGG